MQLVCPACKRPLQQAASEWCCDPCGRRFARHRDVLCFLDPAETLNVTRYADEQSTDWNHTARLRDRLRHRPLLAWLNRVRIRCSLSGRRDRIFLREMGRPAPQPRLILDVGCGGGRHYFCNYGRVVGLDPMLDLLQISRQIYDEVYQASALEMPFADGTFDYVVSSDVIGHIPREAKDALFAEMFRVLKKGGRTVHVIETDSTNVWFRLAHRHPEFFQETFVQRPGHIGLETPTRLRERFLKHGFREVTFRRMASAVQECGNLSGCFDHPIKAHYPFLRFAVALDRLLSRNLLVKEAVNLLLEPVAQIEDLVAPLDHASGALVVFEK